MTGVLGITVMFAFMSGNVTRLTVYGSGNIEVQGENYFRENINVKYTFSDYRVKEGSSNKFDSNYITLEPKFYEQYRQAMEGQKQTTIKVK